jgi:copper chaperone
METGMSKSRNRYQLPLAQAAAGCSCCSSEPSNSVTDTGAVEFTVEGLTCGHCVRTVEDAVTALDGVESASVELVSGGRSRLYVSGKAAGADVREAVTSAGYTASNN